MESRELRGFCVAARLRSISKAAEFLGVGQPTVTAHIKKLEQELGALLFDRVKRPIQLTLSGRTLAQLATPLIDGIDTLRASTFEAEEQGPVVVASPPDTVRYTLLRVMRVFVPRYPDVQLIIRSRNSDEVRELVADGEVDIGLVPHHIRSDVFDFQGLFRSERVLITPLAHPLLAEPLHSVDQLAEWPLILTGPGTGTRTLLEEEFRRRGVHYSLYMELDTMDTIKQCVALGMGISVGPSASIEPEDHRNLGIVSLANLLPVNHAGMITLRGKTLSTPAQNFISIMKDTLAPARSRG